MACLTQVFDAGMFTKQDQLIGSFGADALSVYFQEGHECVSEGVRSLARQRTFVV